MNKTLIKSLIYTSDNSTYSLTQHENSVPSMLSYRALIVYIYIYIYIYIPYTTYTTYTYIPTSNLIENCQQISDLHNNSVTEMNSEICPSEIDKKFITIELKESLYKKNNHGELYTGNEYTISNIYIYI